MGKLARIRQFSHWDTPLRNLSLFYVLPKNKLFSLAVSQQKNSVYSCIFTSMGWNHWCINVLWDTFNKSCRYQTYTKLLIKTPIQHFSPILPTRDIFKRELWNKLQFIKIISMLKEISIVKLLAKAKLKSLPYNHTDHHLPPTRNFQSNVNKSKQILHQHMMNH